MSQENVEVIRRLFKADARRDSEAILLLYDEEVELEYSRIAHAEVVGRGLYRGHEGLRSWYREWFEAWDSFEQTYEELIDAGEHVVSVVRQRGAGARAGPRSGCHKSPRSATARSFEWSRFPLARKPSKPWGSRSR